MNSAALTPATKARSTEMARRVESLDWQQIAVDLDAYGCAMAKGVLLGDECGELAALYRQDAPFRSRIAMSRHGFGRGEYKYWAYPLPETVATPRNALCPHLAEVANRWNRLMKIEVRYPAQHATYLAQCHQAGQTKPTPLLLQYGEGDFNCLHQDCMATACFRCRPPSCSRFPARISPAASSRSQSSGHGCSPARKWSRWKKAHHRTPSATSHSGATRERSEN